MNMYRIILVFVIALLSACASKPPPAIDRELADIPSLTRVRIDIDAYIDTEVRWGGFITEVENRAEGTWIEIVGQKLASNGRPVSGRSDGRFIASFDKFLDPVVYKSGMPLTVVGRIESGVSRPIGDFEYRFPVVSVDGSFLWKKRTPAPAYPSPWWYYDPWYHPWPYYHHHHRH